MPRELIKEFGETDDGDFYVDVYGVPFGGPDYMGGKDFDGEYFDKETDIGPLKEVLSYFRHAKDPNFGKDLIGSAQRLGMDEEGWIYRIVLDQANKYHNVLKRLAKEHVLGASSTPFQRSAEKDASGHWERWHVVEVALTPMPNNPLAQQIFEKELGEEIEMANKPAPKEDAKVPEKETPAIPENEKEVEKPVDTTATDTQEKSGETLVEQIENAFKEEEEVKTVEKEKAAEQVTLAQILAEVQKVNAKNEKLEKELGDIKTALPLMSTYIAKALRGEASKELQKSTSEKQAEQILQSRRTTSSKLPANAPGNN